MIKIKRVYETPDKQDGARVLVDRLWPRGVNKEKAKIDLWVRQVAPGDDLRTWFSHDPEKWDAFRQRYFKELDNLAGGRDLLDPVITRARKGTITLLYAAKDKRYNNAVALAEYLHDRYKV